MLHVDGLRRGLFQAHLDERLDSLEQYLPFWIDVPVFQGGSFCVAIFFVLSEFVIAHSLRNVTIDLTYFRRFIIRLTPPYYRSIAIALGFSLLATVIKQQPFAPMGEVFSIERLIAHLFYVQEFVEFTNFSGVY